MSWHRKDWLPWLAVALGAGAALAGFARPQRDSAEVARAEPPRAEPPSPPRAASAPAVPLPPPTLEADGSESLEGEVLERIAVDKYTYLRLGESGSAGVWAAVPATTIGVGARVKLVRAERMNDFTSATLKRSFPVIYFGTLAGEAADAPVTTASATASAQSALKLGQVARASGANGHTVAELFAERAALRGRRVRVRAVVVKSVEGVLGRNFLHVRDGSGDERQNTHDLSVTSKEHAAVGSEVLLEGTLGVDKDFGAGYRYPVLLEDAQLLSAK